MFVLTLFSTNSNPGYC